MVREEQGPKERTETGVTQERKRRPGRRSSGNHHGEVLNIISPSEEQKVQRLLDLLEEQGVILKRMEATCGSLEKALRERLNDDPTQI